MALKQLTRLNSRDYGQDFNDYIQETFIAPIEKLGFNFTGISSTTGDDTAVHLLQFEGSDYNLMLPINKEQLDNIANGDDEGSTWNYQYYFGTLIITIISSE